MKIFEKVKNFFIDEEEYEEDEEEVINKKKEISKPKIKEDIRPKEEKEITERELFKAERTFNFPMDMDDDFVPVQNEEKEEVKKEPVIKKEQRQRKKSYSAPVINEVKKEEPKKFRPTPIISPIYGIMEGEYIKPEEKKEDLTKTKEFSITKRVNFDEVREKAYGPVKNEYEEEEETEENKSIFFNLNEEEEKESYIPDDMDDTSDIKITYNDVDYNSEEENEEDEIEVPKIKRLRSKKSNDVVNENEEDAILSETKEQDLFNLIDNMYNSDDEEEDE